MIIGAVLGSAALLLTVAAVVMIVYRRSKEITPSQPAVATIPVVKDIEIGIKLGEGNFGEVYRGKAFGGEDIAIKKLKPECVDDFLQESNMLAKIRHVNFLCSHL